MQPFSCKNMENPETRIQNTEPTQANLTFFLHCLVMLLDNTVSLFKPTCWSLFYHIIVGRICLGWLSRVWNILVSPIEGFKGLPTCDLEVHLIVNLRICVDLAFVHPIIHQASILYGQVPVRGREAGTWNLHHTDPGVRAEGQMTNREHRHIICSDPGYLHQDGYMAAILSVPTVYSSRFFTLQGRKAVSPTTADIFLLIFMNSGCSGLLTG
jgi:hypothetical protein